jgi:hypothetical protein
MEGGREAGGREGERGGKGGREGEERDIMMMRRTCCHE